MQHYNPVTSYVADTRSFLQDLIAPYRYTDDLIVGALNVAISEAARIRPDLFLDLKYQNRLNKGDIDDGMPALLLANDSTLVPIPAKYYQPAIWYIAGYLQFFDVADTQDARATAFIQKYHAALNTVAV